MTHLSGSLAGKYLEPATPNSAPFPSESLSIQPRFVGSRSVLRQVAKGWLGAAFTLHWKIRYPTLIRLLDQIRHCRIYALCRFLLRETGGQVSSGPFVTMALTESLAFSSPQFILGSYEEELHDVLNDIILLAPTQVIDIGASRGYYAVGLALKIQAATVTAFEAVQQPYWEDLAALARLNGVSGKIDQRGFCTVEALAAVCQTGAFVLCDCEGGEAEILDPLLIPALLSCTLLIELHEFYRPHLLSILTRRFSASHHLRILEGSARDAARYAALRNISPRWRETAVGDFRWIERDGSKVVVGARFLLLTPRPQMP